MGKVFKDYLHLHFIVFIWGFTGVLGKLIQIPAMEMVFYRTLIAALGLGLLLKLRKRSFRMSSKRKLQMLGTGVIIGLHWIFFYASIKVSTVSVCLAGIATVTLWTSLLEPLMGKGKLKWFEVLLGIIVILGLYVIFKFEFNHLGGLILAIISAMLAALFSIINSRFAQHHGHYIITFYELTGAFFGTGLVIFGAWLFFPEMHQVQLGGTGMDFFYLTILALVCTVYPFAVSVELMKRLTVFTINLTINLEPIYGIILAVLIFRDSEKMSPQFYLGTLIILSAVILHPVVNRMMRRRREARLLG